jgi:hypothetical protein
MDRRGTHSLLAVTNTGLLLDHFICLIKVEEWSEKPALCSAPVKPQRDMNNFHIGTIM